MCGIFGLLDPVGLDPSKVKTLRDVAYLARERGTDSIGLAVNTTAYTARKSLSWDESLFSGLPLGSPGTAIGNTRAEPTTEWVRDKSVSDIHPFENSLWAVVHNGVVANDKQLVEQGLVKSGSEIDSAVLPSLLSLATDLPSFASVIFDMVVGSFALLAVRKGLPHLLYAALNYKPLYHISGSDGSLWFASQPKYLEPLAYLGHQPAPLEQYTAWEFSSLVGSSVVTAFRTGAIYKATRGRRALVIHSGGLDSTVAASVAVAKYGRDNVELLHFLYGCRAQRAERRAVKAIAKHLGVPYRLLDVEQLFRRIADSSPLLHRRSRIRKGDEGVEFAYEWVPARNLVMLAVATALAENEGFTTLVLGNNLEESGAYPDNEPEFVARFNHLLPFAVADGRRVTVEMPVGNLMKHQIVRLGLSVGAPMYLCWSCYYNGRVHCGACGPCTMRRTAFEMNGAEDSVQYAS